MRPIAIWLALVFVWVGGAHAQPPAPLDPEAALRSAERGTVRIIALFRDESGELADVSSGSGFVIASGYVVTNAHVLATSDAEASDVFVIPDRGSAGRGVRAEILGGSRALDIALIGAPDLLAPPIPLSRALPGKNKTVHALGYPGVTDDIRRVEIAAILRPAAPYVTAGSIALYSDTAPGGRAFPTIFHTAAINRGNSGGPLIDECGRVIGINTWTASASVDEDGLEVPVGQSIASRIGIVMPMLQRYGVRPTLDDEPCVIKPLVDPALEARLTAAETALADERAARVAAETQTNRMSAERTRLAQSIAAAAFFGAVVSIGGLVVAVRRNASASYRVAAMVAGGVMSVVTLGAYLFSESGRTTVAVVVPDGPAQPIVADDLGADTAPPPVPSAAAAAAAAAAAVLPDPDRPSFDCARARSFAEKTICSDSRLAARDVKMAGLYAKAVSGPGGAEVKAAAAARWRQRETCLDVECIVAWYDRREAELSRAGAE